MLIKQSASLKTVASSLLATVKFIMKIKGRIYQMCSDCLTMFEYIHDCGTFTLQSVALRWSECRTESRFTNK